MSNLFSDIEGTTIEKYLITQKIEKVKELLVYNELSLSEIAYQLNYSSVSYLSNQFKKITGLSPSQFKNVNVINIYQSSITYKTKLVSLLYCSIDIKQKQ